MSGLDQKLPVRSAIASEVFAVLPRDGRIVQFTYGLRSPVPRETVEQAGFTAQRIVWILRNLPPAAIWVYSRGASSPD